MCLDAHFPNAAEPPALFSSDTKIPSMTRNTKIPTFPESDSLLTMPPSSLNSIVFNINSRLPLAYKSAPARIPARSDVYTSFVKSASPIAITGGSNDSAVAYTTLVYSPSADGLPVSIVIASNTANTAISPSITACFLLTFIFIILLPLCIIYIVGKNTSETYLATYYKPHK